MAIDAEGYLYVPDGSDLDVVMTRAWAGATVRNGERTPPWIVVDHSLESVIVARWPGRLWRVKVVDADGVEQAGPLATYTRAVEVEVGDELPASRLFGRHGGAVCSVIAQAGQLDLARVHALAEARHPDASRAYSDAWNAWLVEAGGSSDFRGEDLRGTLGIDSSGKGSPINGGFTVLAHATRNRAASLVGQSAFLMDEEGERCFEPTWSSASSAMLEAAMAFGAPTLTDERGRLILSSAWSTVFGRDPDETGCAPPED